MTLCHLVNIYQIVRGACFLQLQDRLSCKVCEVMWKKWFCYTQEVQVTILAGWVNGRNGSVCWVRPWWYTQEAKIANMKNVGDSSFSHIHCRSSLCLWPHRLNGTTFVYFGSHFTYTVYYNHFFHTDCLFWANLKIRYEVSINICQLPWCHITIKLQPLHCCKTLKSQSSIALWVMTSIHLSTVAGQSPFS
jgi:hypothetical protein